ncbi:glycosyltransferase [Ensifer sp. T173]|uniref:Glycosyltransferase n=1 Tax=Ensifer canadensis TaxID=555315 RepID=A0AAW4FVS0_9HYPH|nr:glycosyltransferase [Ensifer canadensis]MBM3095515.1 glycosyltransferase [Ensifer canadensis]UBI79111.1 glycosyltransferase [Ensifer canadensis]
MKFSIVLNSFNQVATIERTIVSCIKQAVDKEIILVDAGSTDGTLEIVERYRNQIDKIIVNTSVDLGQSHAINLGFANSTGDIQCWINSDDWFEDDGLERIEPIFRANSHPFTWVIACCNLYNEEQKEIFSVRRVNHLDMGVALEYGSRFWVPQQSTFWRREMFETVGPLVVHDHVTMDVEMFMRFTAMRKPYLSSEVVSNYAFHNASKGSVLRMESFVSQNKLRMHYAAMFQSYFATEGLDIGNTPVHFRRALQSDLQRFVSHVRSRNAAS